MKKNNRMKGFPKLSMVCLNYLGKLIFLLTVVGSTHMNVYGQTQFSNFSLKLERATLIEALSEINRLSGNEVIYRDEEVENEKKRITLDFRSVNTLQAVQECLAETKLTCTERNGKVVVVPRTTITITGKVTDDNGHPLPGATIVIKGEKSALSGTSTDVDGNYRLTIPISVDFITVTFIGYKSKEVNVDGRTRINVILEEDIKSMDEVVITGKFTRKAESFTGAARTFDRDELKRVGNTNIFQSLKNLDPSLKILDNMEMGSNPNALPDMRLRGMTSFPGEVSEVNIKGNYTSEPNQPLFILDGFEASLEEVFDLDMNRVENITILKDAASKALYGSKASNGVVVIETSGVNKDGVRVTYSGNLDLEMPDLTSYNLCNAEEKLLAEILEGSVYTNHYDGMSVYHARQKAVLEGLNEYWLSKPLRTGVGQKHSFSFEVGENAVRTLLSVSYNDVAGVMKDSYRRTLTGNLNLSYRKSNLLFRNIATITNNKTQNSPYGTFRDYTLVNPYSRAFDENGNPNEKQEVGYQSAYYPNSPLYDALTNSKDQTSYLSFTNNFYIEWIVLEGLKATARFGITTKKTDADEYYSRDHTGKNSGLGLGDYEKRGFYTVNNGRSDDYTLETLLTYFNTFSKHTFFGNIGWNISASEFVERSSTSQGYISSSMSDYLFGMMYQIDGSPTGASSKNRDVGVLGVVGYTYDDRFLFDGTLRGSGSSVFGSDNRWATFWSIGAGWNIHNERFVKDNIAFLSQLKIRGSIGYTGNQNFKDNKSKSTYVYDTDRFYNSYWTGAHLNNMENPQLKWELKKDYNLGFDLKVLGATLTFDWYLSNTENLVTQITIPASTGFTSVSENLGLVRNSGLEVSFGCNILNRPDYFLNVNANVATNNNKLKKLSDAMKTFNDSQMELATDEERTSPVVMYYEGMNMNTIWAVPSAGIDPADGYEVYINRDGKLTKEWKATDMIAAGVADSKYNGNFGINGEYKGIGISAVFTFKGGGDLYNQTLVDKVENANIRYNVDKRVLYGRWKEKGEESKFRHIKSGNHPMISSKREGSYTRATTRFVQKNNELNLSSLTLYYNVNPEWIKSVGLERLKIQANMNDIWKWSTIKIERGTSYPFARILNLSLSAVF